MIITMDKDFGELVYNSGLTYNGVLLLRIENSSGKEKVRILSKILANYSDEIKNIFVCFRKTNSG